MGESGTFRTGAKFRKWRALPSLAKCSANPNPTRNVLQGTSIAVRFPSCRSMEQTRSLRPSADWQPVGLPTTSRSRKAVNAATRAHHFPQTGRSNFTVGFGEKSWLLKAGSGPTNLQMVWHKLPSGRCQFQSSAASATSSVKCARW